MTLQERDRKNSLRRKYKKIEEEDTGSLFSQTRSLLGWGCKSGPPSRFLIGGKILRKQKEIADAQMEYYVEKIEKIKKITAKSKQGPSRNFEKII